MWMGAFAVVALTTALGAFPLGAFAGGYPSVAAEPAPRTAPVRAPQPSEPDRPAAPVLLSVEIVPDPEPAANAAVKSPTSSDAMVVAAPVATRP